MNDRSDGKDHVKTSWCPGCGNFAILDTLKNTLERIIPDPANLVIVSGIGQAGKTPHYLNYNMFNGLHGRTLPLATGMKSVNPDLKVIAEGGDGDMYGEGGNHLIHAIRRNPDITVIVHNNMVYGLTKGQASPTSQRGFKTGVQVHGVSSQPLNPLALAVTLDAPFVARTFAGDKEMTGEILERAMNHRGFSLVDILQPCVTFNKVNTFKWFKDHIEAVPETHDPTDRMAALELAFRTEKLSVGVIYAHQDRPTFEENLAAYDGESRPLHSREVDREELQRVIDALR